MIRRVATVERERGNHDGIYAYIQSSLRDDIRRVASRALKRTANVGGRYAAKGRRMR